MRLALWILAFLVDEMVERLLSGAGLRLRPWCSGCGLLGEVDGERVRVDAAEVGFSMFDIL